MNLEDMIDPLEALTKDHKKASRELQNREEVKYLVSLYYKMQKNRIMSSNAFKAFNKEDKPSELIEFISGQERKLEDQVKTLLTQYANYNRVGRWAQTNKGIGPIIAAGLNGHIDMDKALTAGHILSYGGYNPNQKWVKGKPRPWNADLKVLFFKIGDSFVKQKSRDKAWYGQLYAARKIYEINKNLNGDYAETAAFELGNKNYDKSTEAYKAYIQGRLPIARIDMRARRFATIFFISHWHTVATYAKYGHIAHRIYAFDILGHRHFIAPDNMDLLPGLEEELKNKYNGIIRIEDSLAHFMKQYGVTMSDIKKVKEEPLEEADDL